MPRSKPPPRTLAPEDERKIQSFLERAAPIVLESPVVDGATWEKLSALAEEVELSADQLRETIEDLRQRGVIQKIDVRPPKPPPLPSAASPQQVSQDTTEFEQEFALSAPPPIPRPTPPRSPRGKKKAKPPGASKQDRHQFAQRAHEIIAEHRGLGPQAHSLLAAAADEFRISAAEMREIIRGETPAQEVATTPEPPERPNASDDDSNARRRWRVEGEPPPEPVQVKKKPSEIFAAFVEQSFEKCPDQRVSSELEGRVIQHGVRVLKLADVYARQIVAAVARRKQLELESQPAETGQPKSQLPPEEEQFRHRAASILAEHRGINAKSRVLLTALAAEFGFTDEKTEQAIASLQERPLSEAARDEQLSEVRLASFRRHLDIALAKLPRAVLLSNTNELLVEQGQERYGVEGETARATIKAAAADLNLSLITCEQATLHIDGLVDQVLGNNLRISPDIRERILSQAAQWGLAAEQADEIIQRRSRQNYRRRRSEQKFANTALMAGVCAVTLVVAFIAWMLLVGITPEPVVEPEANLAERLRAMRTEPGRDDTWWSPELSVALAKCRLEFQPLRLTLDQVRATSGSQRAVAYERLVEQLFRPEYDDAQRLLFLESLSRCYALDPDDTAAGRLGASLLASVPGPNQRLVEDPALYSNAFWGLRVAVASLAESASAETPYSGQRTTSIEARIGQGIGARVDARQPRRQLERDCLGALAEHLFHLLIVSAEAQPLSGTNLHRVIATEAARYLDRTLLDQLNADYLVAILRKSGEQWEEYRDLIARTIESVEPLAVVKIVGLFESTGSEELRAFMEPLLRARTRVKPKPQKVPELAEAFRQSLGIRSDATLAGRQKKYARVTNGVVESLGGTSDQPQLILSEIAQLAWLETLGCALWVQDSRAEETFRRLSNDPISISGTLSPPITDDAALRMDPSKSRMIRADLDRLANRNSFTRATNVRHLSRVDVTDLFPSDARRLADYLMGLKPASERQEVLRVASELGKWKQVRLAVADELDRSKLPIEQIGELVSKLLSSELSSEVGRVPTLVDHRIALLRSVAAEKVKSAETEKASLVDACRQALIEQYLIQIQLFGGGEASAAEPNRLPDVLESLITTHSRRLQRTGLTQATRRQLELLPEQFAAIRFYGADELHRTILLERLWLRVLVIAASTVSDAARDEAAKVAERLRSHDRDADGLLVQLHWGHQAVVEVWTLLAGAVRRSR